MTKTKKKPECEVKDTIFCRGPEVTPSLMTGTKKGDPKFWCCWGCEIALRRMGVRIKPASK